MKVLVINCGSSSLKYQLIDSDTEAVIAKGLCERIGIDGKLTHQTMGKDKYTVDAAMPDHNAAVKFVLDALLDTDKGAIASLSEIDAVGHRIVHGGEKFANSVVITDEVMAAIEECNDLAPLHNPANLIGIRACQAHMPGVPMVAVFDTAFHQTMPEEAYLYALPYSLYKEHGVRRYGAHGTSHYFVSREVAEYVGKPADQVNAIICHLGNGGSVSVVRHGKCIDTSMGLTPLEGLVMGTRCGDIDPAIVFYLYKNLGMSMEQIEETLVKKSGLLGLTEVTSDCRYAEDNYDDASKPEAKRALDVYSYRLAKYIGAYMAVLGDDHLDAIAFTGGIGENSAHVRELTLNHLKLFGVKLDHDRNLAARFGKSGVITADDSAFKAIVLPTNEELVIAQDTARLAG